MPLARLCHPMQIRPATIDDAKRLFDWRNDPVTRRNSRNMDTVAWCDHVSWLASTIERDDRIFLIGESEGVPVGTIRFDRRLNDYEVSWTAAPEHRGQGHMKRLAMLACSQIKEPIYAEIKRTNLPTNNIIAACGFALIDERDGLGIWLRPTL